MYDAKIISACIQSREAYNRVREHVDTDEFTPTGEFWWKQLERWYQIDSDAPRADLSVLQGRGSREAGAKAEMALEWLSGLPEAPSPDNVAQEVLELRREIAYRKMTAAFEEEWDYDRLTELTENHYKLMQATSLEEPVEYAAIDELLERDPEHLIPLMPATLNERLGGGCEPGSHIVLFARVEAGKTLFAVNAVAGWLRAGKRVLYLGNEEPVRRIAERIRWNLSGLTAAQCGEFEPTMWQRCAAKGWHNLKMAQIHPGTPEVVEQYVKDFKPDCLVIDQLRNLHATGRTGTRAQALDRVANNIRQITTKYNLVTLSIGQANAGDHGKPQIWFEADDFDESRTGVPASADVMIALGFNSQLDVAEQRAVSLCKNKLTGDHEGFIIELDKQRSRIK